MSADIENAVFASQDGAGWTGLGLAIPEAAAKDPRKIAGLLDALWSVESKEVFYKTSDGKFRPISNTRAQVRSDSGDVLSVTSENRYHIDRRQPLDILETFRDDLNKNNLMISHAAVLNGGKIITVSARVPDYDFKVGPGTLRDAIHAFISLSTGYDKIHGTPCVPNGIREVCCNTHAMNISEAEEAGTLRKFRASQKLEADSLTNLLHGVAGVFEKQKTEYNAMLNKKMSEAEVSKFFADTLEINIADLGKTDKNGVKLVSTRSENMLRALAAAYKNAPGATQGNAWGAFNSVTYYATHEKSCRATDRETAVNARIASNLFGDAAKLKARAFDLLKVAA